MSDRTLRQRAPAFSIEPAFTIEVAQADDEPSFCDVFELMLALHKEGGYAPLNTEKASQAVYDALTGGMTWIARAMDGENAGEPIGVLCMKEVEFWYSDDTFLVDVGFYVAPEHRGGEVGVELLRACRDEAEARGKIALITVTSPDRKPKRTRATIVSQLAGYVPVGYTLQLTQRTA